MPCHLPPLCLGLLLLLSSAEGCSVPVFAYALRRWEPEAHTLTTSREEAWRQALAREAEEAQLNLMVEAGDGLDRLSHRANRGSWWTGPVDAPHRQTLISSPLRQELARRLASGQTAVWLFVPGGEAADDAAARTLLEERLAYLKQAMALPQAEADDDTAALVLASAGPPVRLEFSLLEMRRDDPGEWVLAAQVQAMAKTQRGPCVIPVYGRARALVLLQGEELSAAAIDDVAEFLTGACSCQVKEMNPGWDLLLACNWEAALNAAAEEQPAAAMAATAAAKPETVVISPQQPLTVTAVAVRTVPWGAILLGAGAVCVAIGLAIRRARRRSEVGSSGPG